MKEIVDGSSVTSVSGVTGVSGVSGVAGVTDVSPVGEVIVGGAGANSTRPEGFRRVEQALRERCHSSAPRFLEVAARTSQEAAEALGVSVGQIAKSVVFRRKADDVAVMVVTSGDRRVDERKVSALVGAIGRADPEFVKTQTGFTIGGVSPVGLTTPVVMLIDRDLFRFDIVWAAAGHPNGVFSMTPAELERLTGAPVHDVTP